jgi:hypothetical protein
MSTDVLTEIVGLLRNYENISFQVFLKPGKKGTRLTTISIEESTGIQSNPKSSRKSSNGEKKKQVKKSPSRLLRDGKRQEAFRSRKAGSCERDLAPPADPDPSTTQRTDRMDPRRSVKPGRRLHKSVGAGQEEEWRNWRPAPVEERIPQLDGLDGEGADLEKEKEKEEGNQKDEMDVRDEKEEEEENGDDNDKDEGGDDDNDKDESGDDDNDKDESGDVLCIHEVRIKTCSFQCRLWQFPP